MAAYQFKYLDYKGALKMAEVNAADVLAAKRAFTFRMKSQKYRLLGVKENEN